MTNMPRDSYNHHDEAHTEDVQRTLEQARPPNLNPQCPAHGGQAGGLQDDGDVKAEANTNGNGSAGEFMVATYIMSEASDDGYSSELEMDYLTGEEGIENAADAREVQVSDLGCHSVTSILRAIHRASPFEYHHCHCHHCGCPCQAFRAPTPNGDGFSMVVSPSSSGVFTPIDSMVVEIGSMASSTSLDGFSWSASDLLAGIHRGIESGELVRYVPQNFVQPPLSLTNAPAHEVVVYQYASHIHDSDL